MQEAIKKQLHLAVWRNWQTRLIQNQVSYGREGSSPFTAISGIALVCIFPQAFADCSFLLVASPRAPPCSASDHDHASGRVSRKIEVAWFAPHFTVIKLRLSIIVDLLTRAFAKT